MANKRGPKLKTLADVSSFLARIIRELYRDNLDLGKAGKLAYMCNVLKGTLEAGDLEQRIETLEAQIRGEAPDPDPKTLLKR